MFIIIIMPKRTSKRKPRKVTKRKTKRKKRRRRRFGSSLASNTTRTPIQALMEMIRGDNPIAETNADIMRLARGEPVTDSTKFMAMIGPRGSTRKIKQINGLVKKTGALMANSTSSAQEKKEIFHTVLVAIVSLLYQSIKDLSKKNEKYESNSKEVRRLAELRQTQSHAALTAVSDDTTYEELTDFKPVETDKGNIIGFTYKYKNNDISVTMIVRYNTDEDSIVKMVAKTFLDKYNEYYETEIMEQDGTQTITSTQTGNNETITTPNNTSQIVQQVDDLLADFSQMVIIPAPPEVDIMGEPLVDDTVSVVDDNLFDDVSNTGIDDESKGNNDEQGVMGYTRQFGRRKRKRKVSKKKVSNKKGPSAALKKLCKRLKVKLTVKRGKKRVYKSEKVLKAQCKKASKKSSFGKKKKTVKRRRKSPSAALKKLCKLLKVKLTTKRGGKRVYKSEKVLKAQCKKAAKKSSFGKKKKRRKRKFGR